MARWKREQFALPCQVCDRLLAVQRNGLVKKHKPPGGRGREADYCRGTGYRHARWPVGQRLRHHTTGIWEIVEDRGDSTPYRDYLIRCVKPTLNWGGEPMEEHGKEVVAHGEYMHRHGWTPVEDDCTCGHEFIDHDHRTADAHCLVCEEPYECSHYEPDREPLQEGRG